MPLIIFVILICVAVRPRIHVFVNYFLRRREQFTVVFSVSPRVPLKLTNVRNVRKEFSENPATFGKIEKFCKFQLMRLQ